MEATQGKVVLVTGAASGIGQATAERLRAGGAIVVGLDVQEAEGIVQADVTSEDAVASAVAGAVDEHGRIDGLVHAAGVAGGGPVHLLSIDDWRRVIDVNLTATFIVCKHVLARMVEQEPLDGERGSIVTLASIEGLEGTAGGSAYNASKGGVVLLTKNIAIDYGRLGIRANAICPGFVQTPMTDAIFGLDGMQDVRAQVVDEHKLRRMAQPVEIANVAAFLLSPEASFVSGQAIGVDGAYTAGRDHGVTQLMGL